MPITTPPYPPVPYQLETALVVQLRDVIRWDAGLAPANAQGQNSGTLTVPDTTQLFVAEDYGRRDRELAWLDTRNAAAVVEVSLEVADVWNAQALRPTMQGPQIGHLAYQAQDANYQGLSSKVVYVKNASIPVDALSTDRDLDARDVLIYETLSKAVQTLFQPPPITPSGVPPFTPVTAFSLASAAEARKEINPALPLNRDLFRDPDMNLADRDNQMAGYVAQLCQVLKNPFVYADRLYVRATGNADPREVEVYTYAEQTYESSAIYVEGDEVLFEGQVYRVRPGAVSTSEDPATGPWDAVTPTQRVWLAEPHLTGRNRFVYDTQAMTLQWFREKTDLQHVPQLFALSIPGIFADQTLDTIAQVPERKDGQFWRGKAGRIIPAGTTLKDLAQIPNTATFSTVGFTVQPGGASLTIPAAAKVWFPDPTTNAHTVTLNPGDYRISALVEPNSTVELPGGENHEAIHSAEGGVDYPGHQSLTWSIGLPPNTPWTMELDYMNSDPNVPTDGFRLIIMLDSEVVYDDTAAFFYNDEFGNPINPATGTIVTSPAFPIVVSGGLQVLTINWVRGTGTFHLRAIRFKSNVAQGHYRMSGTLAGKVAVVDVIGDNEIPGVVAWDFTLTEPGPTDFLLNWEMESQLPIRFLRFDLAAKTPNASTPNVAGFSAYRHDCLLRAVRSAQQSFTEIISSGTDPVVFTSDDGNWDQEQWMATIEQAEPRLRQIDNVAVDAIRPGRLYRVLKGQVTYQTKTYAAPDPSLLPDQQPYPATFSGDVDTYYVWNGVAGTLSQQGAWKMARSTHIDRPALCPAGVYYDYAAGTVAMAYGTEQPAPTLSTLQPWMIMEKFYTAQTDFWIPSPPS
jgi:hypothetical protein